MAIRPGSALRQRPSVRFVTIQESRINGEDCFRLSYCLNETAQKVMQFPTMNDAIQYVAELSSRIECGQETFSL